MSSVVSVERSVYNACSPLLKCICSRIFSNLLNAIFLFSKLGIVLQQYRGHLPKGNNSNLMISEAILTHSSIHPGSHRSVNDCENESNLCTFKL